MFYWNNDDFLQLNTWLYAQLAQKILNGIYSLCYCKPKLMIYSHTLPFMSEKLLLFFICIASHVAFGCCNSYTYATVFSVIWSRKKLVKCIDSRVTLHDLTRKVWGGVVSYAIFQDFSSSLWIVTKSKLKLLNSTKRKFYRIICSVLLF